MAYVSPLLSEDEKKKQSEQGGVQTSTGQSTVIQGSGGQQSGSSSQPATPKKQSGSGWTNLSAYVNANQGQGQRMANERADNIALDTETQKSRVNQETNKFLQDQGIYDQQGQLNKSQFDTKNIKRDFRDTDFTKVGQDEFQSLYNQSSDKFGAFKPQKETPKFDFLANPEEIRNQSTNFNWRVSELQDEYGKNKPYSRGQQNLDAFLLGDSDLANKRATATQSVKDYAFRDPNAGVNKIQGAYDQFGQLAKEYDRSIGESKGAYQKAYGDQLKNLSDIYSQTEQKIKGIAPKASIGEVDASGNIVGTGAKADKVYTAPNGKKYAVVVDSQGFERLIDPLKSQFQNYSKVAGLTNQKVNPMTDYQTLYNQALEQATKDAIANYDKQNVLPPPTLPDLGGTAKRAFDPGLMMKRGGTDLSNFFKRGGAFATKEITDLGQGIKDAGGEVGGKIMSGTKNAMTGISNTLGGTVNSILGGGGGTGMGKMASEIVDTSTWVYNPETGRLEPPSNYQISRYAD